MSDNELLKDGETSAESLNTDVGLIDSDIDRILMEAEQVMETVSEKKGNKKEEKESPKSTAKEVVSFLKVNVFPIVIGVLIGLFVSQVCLFFATVPSGSMETTIMTKDHIIANRMAYWFNEPKNGDIVVFWSDEYDEYMIKRVIGVPGDTIKLENGFVYVNGELTNAEYTSGPSLQTGSENYWEVPEGCYFMMGDNRINSCDSRYWSDTYIEKNRIYAKYLARYSLKRGHTYFIPDQKINFYAE